MGRGGRAFRTNSLHGRAEPTSTSCLLSPTDTQSNPNARAAIGPSTAEVRSFTEAPILTAIRSLYDDELRPYGRILRKRLGEQTRDVKGSYIDTENLKAFCRACPRLRVELEDGGEWFALLMDRPPDFVDIYSSSDTYPEALWRAFAVYLSTPGDRAGGADVTLPGGRYLCAQALMGLRLPFLAGCSFGQTCHIVQLAISQRNLLGYLDGGVVPYARSGCLVKSLCAARQRPCVHKDSDALDVADWDVARTCLVDILQVALSRGESRVPLSNVKRLFRSVHQTDLSETALGHTRLSDLLQDPRFQDICTVELQNRGYAVVPTPQMAIQVALRAAALSNAADQVDVVSPSSLSKDLSARSMLQNTFIHAALPPPTPMLQREASRSQSVPKHIGLCQAGGDVCSQAPPGCGPCTWESTQQKPDFQLVAPVCVDVSAEGAWQVFADPSSGRFWDYNADTKEAGWAAPPAREDWALQAASPCRQRPVATRAVLFASEPLCLEEPSPLLMPPMRTPSPVYTSTSPWPESPEAIPQVRPGDFYGTDRAVDVAGQGAPPPCVLRLAGYL